MLSQSPINFNLSNRDYLDSYFTNEKKLKLREDQGAGQGHRDGERWSQNSNPSLSESAPEPFGNGHRNTTRTTQVPETKVASRGRGVLSGGAGVIAHSEEKDHVYLEHHFSRESNPQWTQFWHIWHSKTIEHAMTD